MYRPDIVAYSAFGVRPEDLDDEPLIQRYRREYDIHRSRKEKASKRWTQKRLRDKNSSMNVHNRKRIYT